MLTRLKQWLAPPVFEDEEKTQVASLLNVVLWVMIVATVIFFLIEVAASSHVPSLARNSVLFLVELTGLHLMRRGYVRPVSIVLVLVLWMSANSLILEQGIYDPVIILYVTSIVMGGLLLGGWAAIVLALLSGLAGLGILYAERNGVLQPLLPTSSPLVVWSGFFGNFLMVAVMLHLATRALRDSLARSRRNEQITAEVNRALEHEISERRKVEEERRRIIGELEIKNVEVEAQRSEMEQFTYAVSHDLKSPLVTVMGFVNLMEKDAAVGDTGRLAADAQRIYRAVNKMNRLLDDLLQLSRVGRVPYVREEVNLGELARDAAEMVAGRITKRGVAVEISPHLPTVLGDRVRLLEVLQNLIDNAVKFMGDQTAPRVEIGVEYKEEAGGDSIYVRDNGLGIEVDFQEKVFGIFERLAPDVEGTGIGLSLVKRVIEMHGGRIWVESAGKGKGSTFYFMLAGLDEPAAESSQSLAPPA